MSIDLPKWAYDLKGLDGGKTIFDHVRVAYTTDRRRVVVAQPYGHVDKVLPDFIAALRETDYHLDVMDSWYAPGYARAIIISN